MCAFVRLNSGVLDDTSSVKVELQPASRILHAQIPVRDAHGRTGRGFGKLRLTKLRKVIGIGVSGPLNYGVSLIAEDTLETGLTPALSQL